MSQEPFAVIDTHSPGHYIANQAANPLNVTFHDLPPSIEIYVDQAVLSDAAFPRGEVLRERRAQFVGDFVQEGVAAALRNERFEDCQIIYSDPERSELQRLRFAVEGSYTDSTLKIEILPDSPRDR